MHSVPNRQIFTARLSLKPWMCVGTVLCVANTKHWLFRYAVMCSGEWKHPRVHPIKRLLCVSDFGWQWGQWGWGDNGGRWWQLAECIQPAHWISVGFPQVGTSSFLEVISSRGQSKDLVASPRCGLFSFYAYIRNGKHNVATKTALSSTVTY